MLLTFSNPQRKIELVDNLFQIYQYNYLQRYIFQIHLQTKKVSNHANSMKLVLRFYPYVLDVFLLYDLLYVFNMNLYCFYIDAH